MARNNLTPTPVVDRNGKTTTVYRRAERLKPAASALPAPSAAPQPSGGTTTPLTLPKALTAKEKRELGNLLNSIDVTRFVPASHFLLGLSAKPLALLKRIADEFPDHMPLLKKILGNAISNECLPEEMVNVLLVSERLLRDNRGHLLESAAYGVIDTVVGMCHSENRLPDDQVIRTEEELAGKAALTDFILTHGRKHDLDSMTKTLYLRRGAFIHAEYMALRNRHLEQLILDRPEDIEVISRYVAERGMHHANKKPVEALRAYLDDESLVVPVSGGWL
jgi:hypothetical protein